MLIPALQGYDIVRDERIVEVRNETDLWLRCEWDSRWYDLLPHDSLQCDHEVGAQFLKVWNQVHLSVRTVPLRHIHLNNNRSRVLCGKRLDNHAWGRDQDPGDTSALCDECLAALEGQG